MSNLCASEKKMQMLDGSAQRAEARALCAASESGGSLQLDEQKRIGEVSMLQRVQTGADHEQG